MKYLIVLLSLLFLTACGTTSKTEDQDEVEKGVIEFFGNTQGTTYAVIVNDDIELTMEEIESTLADFDLALSSYIPNSVLTGINEAPAGEHLYSDPHDYFSRCYIMAQEVYKVTNGYFDPTVYPLVDGWGFMKNVEVVPDSSTVDSLRALLGFNDGYHFKFMTTITDHGDTIPSNLIRKNTPAAKLDFNAIAQGLAVDVLCELIEKKGGENYFVEIGGEIRVNGLNREDVLWRIGIDKPVDNSTAENRELQEIIQLDGQAIATSGNYRKFYEKDGVKYSHTLNPKTGYPVTHTLLSASVVTESCAMADAMATAIMVMGPDKGMDFAEEHPELNLEIYLVFENDKGRLETYSTKGFQKLITD